MESVKVMGGSVLLIVGTAFMITSMFRGVGQRWPMRRHERWGLPAAGLSLVVLGQWLIS